MFMSGQLRCCQKLGIAPERDRKVEERDYSMGEHYKDAVYLVHVSSRVTGKLTMEQDGRFGDLGFGVYFNEVDEQTFRKMVEAEDTGKSGRYYYMAAMRPMWLKRAGVSKSGAKVYRSYSVEWLKGVTAGMLGQLRDEQDYNYIKGPVAFNSLKGALNKILQEQGKIKLKDYEEIHESLSASHVAPKYQICVTSPVILEMINGNLEASSTTAESSLANKGEYVVSRIMQDWGTPKNKAVQLWENSRTKRRIIEEKLFKMRWQEMYWELTYEITENTRMWMQAAGR